MRASQPTADPLPSPSQREWVLDQLAAICKRRGVEPILAWPLILPTVDYFPAPIVVSSDRALARILRRLLWYAGLDELRVELDFIAEGAAPLSFGSSEFAVQLASVEGASCRFAVHRDRIGSAADLVAECTREVVRVYRRRGGLEVDDGELDARLADITAVYLGFGVLLCAGSSRTWSSSASTRMPTGLSAASLSFAVAVWCCLRDPSEGETAAVEALLGDELGRLFRASIAVLEDSDQPLITRLALPPRDEWPPVDDIEQLIAMQSDNQQDRELAAELAFEGSSSGPTATHTTDPSATATTRQSDARTEGTAIGIAAGAVLSALVAGSWPLGLLLPFAGFVVGKTIARDRCGAQSCFARVRLNERCPKCGTLAIREDHPWV
ncbi:MAG: hypothetical protein JNK05_35785 [Myxococcales bacterium]|nr:hypothetical protein [Myxococcales bacterium]